MATYAAHFYGLDLTDVRDDFSEVVADAMLEGETAEPAWCGSYYDGNGSSITFIGVTVPIGAKGIVVTAEVEAAARTAYDACPPIVREAILAALDVAEFPEPTFHVRTGWG